MASVSAVDAIDITHHMTQLLLQILPKTEGANDRCCTPEGQVRSARSEGYENIKQASSEQLEAREQAGCHLWDMTSSEEAASVAVQHAALEIMPKVMTEALSQNQPRLAELLAGALANVLCHRALAEQVS